jgi:hypothetical protein
MLSHGLINSKSPTNNKSQTNNKSRYATLLHIILGRVVLNNDKATLAK